MEGGFSFLCTSDYFYDRRSEQHKDIPRLQKRDTMLSAVSELPHYSGRSTTSPREKYVGIYNR